MKNLNIVRLFLGLFIAFIVLIFVYIIFQDHRESLDINNEVKKSLRGAAPNYVSTELLISLKQTSSVFTKITLLIIGAFMLILIGCMLVLIGIEASYNLSMEHKEFKSNLKTTSPGLVLVTLGAILLSFVTFKDYSTTSEIIKPITVEKDENSQNLRSKKEQLVKELGELNQNRKTDSIQNNHKNDTTTARKRKEKIAELVIVKKQILIDSIQKAQQTSTISGMAGLGTSSIIIKSHSKK